MASDLDRALRLLGELRGQLLKIPGPTPLKDALQEADQLAGRVEDEIRAGGRRTRPFLTFQEATEFLNVSHQTLYRLMSEGLPGFRVGKQRAFFPEDLIAWIRSQRG